MDRRILGKLFSGGGTMNKLTNDSPRVTLGDPKEYPNWQSARETNTPLQPRKPANPSAHVTADPQGQPNERLKPNE
jgi:hypothetical protein